MIDLGEDLDVEGAVAFLPARSLAEVAGQVAQVFGAELDRDLPRLLPHGRQVAPAVTGKDHPVDAGGNLEVPADPLRRHQGGHRDRQDGDLGDEPGARGQLVEHLAEGELGEPAGDEEDAGRRFLFSGIHADPALRIVASAKLIARPRR